MTSELTPKFSQEELHDCKNWLLPDVSSKESIPSAEKEALDKSKDAISNNKNHSVKPSPNESIETIEELVAPMTADELQKISTAAEKEGFDCGFKEGMQKALDQGKEQGLKEGYEEGMMKAKETISLQCEQLQHVIDALLIPLETEQQQLQVMILNMVTELAKAVVLRELKLDSSHITQLVGEALSAIPVGADKFLLYLSEQDKEHVEKYIENINRGHEKNILLHIDENLLPGGCRLETKQTVVDYSVEQRLQKVFDGFLQKRFIGVESEINDDTDKQCHIKSSKDDTLTANVDTSPLEQAASAVTKKEEDASGQPSETLKTESNSDSEMDALIPETDTQNTSADDVNKESDS